MESSENRLCWEGGVSGLSPSVGTSVQHILGTQQGFPAKGRLLLKVGEPCPWLQPECHHYQHCENSQHTWQWVLFPQCRSKAQWHEVWG